MKKLINKLLIPTMLTGLSTTMVSTLQPINITHNINEINHDLVLMIWIDNLLTDDCLTNFQKHYRLKANNFKFLTYNEIAKEFELFLHQKYQIGFKIDINEENQIISTNKQHIIKINISLYKKNEAQWKILNSNLSIHFKANNTFKKLDWLKAILEYNGYNRFIKNKKFNNVNEVVTHLNEIFGKIEQLKDIKVELSEDFTINSLFYCQNLENFQPDFLANFIYLNLKIDSYTMPTVLTNLQTNFEIENLDEFKAFSNFNIFIRNLLPQFNLKYQLSNNGNNVTDYSYQNFVEYLNDEYIDYYSWHEEMLAGFPYIKLNGNQNQIFINGKNIVKLLVIKNENAEQYIAYDLPVYWHDGIKKLSYTNDFYNIKNNIFLPFHYPNNSIIESSELKKDQPQISAYNLILEQVQNKIIDIPSLHQTMSLNFTNPNQLLENNHNIISANIRFAEYEFPIDFHIMIDPST